MHFVTVKKFWDFFDLNNINDCKMVNQFLKIVKKKSDIRGSEVD
jgi:hypothetical protein